VADCIEEKWRERCFSAREQYVDFSLRLERGRLCKDGPYIVHIQLMNELGCVRIHVAGRTNHIAAVREVDNQVRTSSLPDTVWAVIVNRLVVGTVEILSKGKALHFLEKVRMIRKHVFEWAMPVAGLAYKDSACFLHYLRIDDSGSLSKVGDRGITADQCLYCFSITVRAEG